MRELRHIAPLKLSLGAHQGIDGFMIGAVLGQVELFIEGQVAGMQGLGLPPVAILRRKSRNTALAQQLLIAVKVSARPTTPCFDTVEGIACGGRCI